MTMETSTLALHLAPLRPFLDDPALTEIAINEPATVFTEDRDGWARHDVPAVTQQWCLELAKLIANDTKQSIDPVNPLLAGQLPTGERVQVAIPPVVPHGTTSVTIRKPSTVVFSLEAIIAAGAFEQTRCEQSLRLPEQARARLENDLPEDEADLLRHFRSHQWLPFFDLAIQRRKNIVSSGPTSSGKTTLANALVQRIPAAERLITVEDVREMRLGQPNKVCMTYSKDAKGLSKATPKQIFEANLRQRPSRVLAAELRGDEAFFFLQNVINSGHPGTITSVHANAAKLCFQRLSMMIKASPEGASLHREDVLEMLYSLIDIVVQMERRPNGQCVVREIYYDPAYARQQMG